MRESFDEVSEVGALFMSGCGSISPSGIQIEVSEAYDDGEPDRNGVLVECHGGPNGIVYLLDPDEAEALAGLLRSAARKVRRNSEQGDKNGGT